MPTPCHPTVLFLERRHFKRPTAAPWPKPPSSLLQCCWTRVSGYLKDLKAKRWWKYTSKSGVCMGIATFSEKKISYKFRKQVGEITITECRHVKILCTNPSWIWSLSQPNFFYSPTIFSLWAHQGQASCKEVRLSCERQSWSSTQTLAWKRKGPGPINWWIIDQGAHSTLPLWGKQPDILTGCPQSGSLMKEGRSPEKEGIWALHKTNKQLGHLQDQRSTMTPSQECSRLDMQKKEQMGVQIRQPHSNMYTSLKERTHTHNTWSPTC